MMIEARNVRAERAAVARRGTACRRRAGEQNAADMRHSGADVDGYRRRRGNEIGDGEYARSRARTKRGR
jgi:hypothetical protein